MSMFAFYLFINTIVYYAVGQEAGHPDEDELYEAAVVSTNMVYEIVNDELVILPEISETMPKIEILDPLKVHNYFPIIIPSL